jgi:hypothetical protein
MTEKKIATSVEVLINVGNYENIRLTKYGESKIEYDSQDEMLQKEERLNDEVVADLVRSMRALPSQLGKKTDAVVEIEEKIKSKIPEWLENNPEPNIANLAQRNHEKAEAEAHSKNEEKKQKTEDKVEEDAELEDLLSKPEDSVESQPVEDKQDTEEKKEEKKEENVEKLDDDLFDDDDLFE